MYLNLKQKDVEVEHVTSSFRVFLILLKQVSSGDFLFGLYIVLLSGNLCVELCWGFFFAEKNFLKVEKSNAKFSAENANS